MLENISAVRHNPTPYNLPVIPHPLPPDVVEGEHFVVARCWVQGVGSMSGASTSSSGSSSSSPPPPPPPPLFIPGRGTRSGHPERLPLLVKVAGPAPRVVRINRKRAPGRRNAPGSKGEDFVPWALADSEGPQDLEEEERQERVVIPRGSPYLCKWPDPPPSSKDQEEEGSRAT